MIDPFESTSRLLSDIASGYRKQGNQRKDREAATAQRKEDIAYRDAQAALAKTNADRSFGLQEKAAERAQKQYEYTVGKQKQKDRDAEILGGLRVNVTKDALSPENRLLLDTNKEAIEAAEGDFAKNVSNLLLRRNYTNDKGEYSAAGKEFYDKRYNEYAKVLSPQEAALRASNDVKMSKEKALADNYDKKAEDTLKSLRASQNVNTDPTLEEFARAGVQQLTEGGEFSSPEAAYDELIKRGKNLGLSSRAEMAAASAAAEDKAYQRSKDRADALNRYYTIANVKNKVGSDGKYKGVTEENFQKRINELDAFGSGDKSAAQTLYDTAMKDPRLKGVVNPNLVREAVLSGVSGDFVGDNEVRISAKEIADRALQLNSFAAKNSTKMSDEDAKKLLDMLTPKVDKRASNGRFDLPNGKIAYDSRLPAIDTEALKDSLIKATSTIKDPSSTANPVSTDVLSQPSGFRSVRSIRQNTPTISPLVKSQQKVADLKEEIATARKEAKMYAKSSFATDAYNRRIKVMEKELADQNNLINQLKQALQPV
jgi:hypothetical protein